MQFHMMTLLDVLGKIRVKSQISLLGVQEELYLYNTIVIRINRTFKVEYVRCTHVKPLCLRISSANVYQL